VLRNGYSILQKTIGYDKVKRNFNRELMFGSSFWSITHDLASYVVSQKKWIFENYHDTSFPEESFLQTVLEDSPFKNRRYTSSNSNLNDHLRLIQWNRQSYSGRGHPHVWTINDVETIRSSNNLFARKFIISIDRHVIDSIIKMTQ